MNATPSFDDLDRALTGLARPPRRGPRRPLSWSSRLRRAWDRHGSLVAALVVGLLVAVAATQSSLWRPGLVVALCFVVRNLLDWWAERSSPPVYATGGDFLAAEREAVEKRLEREGFQLCAYLVLVVLLCAFASASKVPAATLGAAALFAALGALRYGLFVPGLRRELDDLGGAHRQSWLLHVILALLGLFAVLVLPFVLAFHALRDGWRKLRGLPPLPDEPDEVDDDSNDDDSSDGSSARTEERR